MILLSEEKQLAVLAGLVEGNSERGIERATEVNRETVGRLAVRFGIGAQRLHDRLFRNLTCTRLVLDEMWTYCKVKGPRATPAHGPDAGEQWIWVALDQSSRSVVSWHVGRRDQVSADAIALDVRARLSTMPQLIVTDGLAAYKDSLIAAMGVGLTYGVMIKNVSGGMRGPDHRYEPGRDLFIEKRAVVGNPNMDDVTTYSVERNNLTMRHHIGRTRRLCLAFSKKLANLTAAVALNYVHYNLCLVCKPLRMTPAMAMGITDHIWELHELLAVLRTEPAGEKPEPKPLANPPAPVNQTARALPPGRGFLTVVKGGRAPQAPPPATPPPAPMVVNAGPAATKPELASPPATPVVTLPIHTPAPSASPVQVAPAPATPPAVEPPSTPEPSKQLDLFAWRPKGQLSLFGDEPSPRKA